MEGLKSIELLSFVGFNVQWFDDNADKQAAGDGAEGVFGHLGRDAWPGCADRSLGRRRRARVHPSDRLRRMRTSRLRLREPVTSPQVSHRVQAEIRLNFFFLAFQGYSTTKKLCLSFDVSRVLRAQPFSSFECSCFVFGGCSCVLGTQELIIASVITTREYFYGLSGHLPRTQNGMTVSVDPPH